MNCLMDSYLHLNIRDIRDTNFQKGDINISGTRDISIRVQFQGCLQDTKICKSERSTIAINEPIILENAKPSTKNDESLLLQVWDVDTCTNDDLLGVATINLPVEYGRNFGEQEYEIRSPKNQAVVGIITIDQIHFIKQKTVRYMGPCKCCCCGCLELGSEGNEPLIH